MAGNIVLAIATILRVIILGFFYFLGILRQKRSEDIITAKNASEFTIEALSAKIKILQDQVASQQALIEQHTKEIEYLKGRNQTLENLVIIALKSYFEANPTVALEVKQEVSAQ